MKNISIAKGVCFTGCIWWPSFVISLIFSVHAQLAACFSKTDTCEAHLPGAQSASEAEYQIASRLVSFSSFSSWPPGKAILLVFVYDLLLGLLLGYLVHIFVAVSASASSSQTLPAHVHPVNI
ncbi:hypothetical protein FIBSPDRAFT_90804 [Athelia psychrophila]|uniref:Uncharacterized protein n=1 Tax=Athelia psychrophila TaxID=1759441 RepID=A0A166DW06_9AGAM|nr:hypothetical protein FIBSPDRAFT_90804 [Fibularhizoctonia sp. CBS 109695]